jgi:CBS domain containing-hemolysin-like protein
MAASMLISNTLSVAIGQWVTMPLLTSALRPWLKGNAPRQAALSLGGLVLIWLFLAGLMVLFRSVTG